MDSITDVNRVKTSPREQDKKEKNHTKNDLKLKKSDKSNI
jgi:hypothetical protein